MPCKLAGLFKVQSPMFSHRRYDIQSGIHYPASKLISVVFVMKNSRQADIIVTKVAYCCSGAGVMERESRSYSSSPSPSPKSRYEGSRQPPASARPRPGWFKGGSPGIGGVIAGSFLGSALGTVLGNAISSRMYEGRDPETGQWQDPSKEDTNPCKKELDYFLTCAKYVDDLAICNRASDALKQCAEKNKDYFAE